MPKMMFSLDAEAYADRRLEVVAARLDSLKRRRARLLGQLPLRAVLRRAGGCGGEPDPRQSPDRGLSGARLGHPLRASLRGAADEEGLREESRPRRRGGAASGDNHRERRCLRGAAVHLHHLRASAEL